MPVLHPPLGLPPQRWARSTACAAPPPPPARVCEQDVERKGRLMPGNILLVDFDAHELVDDEAVRHGSRHALL